MIIFLYIYTLFFLLKTEGYSKNSIIIVEEKVVKCRTK